MMIKRHVMYFLSKNSQAKASGRRKRRWDPKRSQWGGCLFWSPRRGGPPQLPARHQSRTVAVPGHSPSTHACCEYFCFWGITWPLVPTVTLTHDTIIIIFNFQKLDMSAPDEWSWTTKRVKLPVALYCSNPCYTEFYPLTGIWGQLSGSYYLVLTIYAFWHLVIPCPSSVILLIPMLLLMLPLLSLITILMVLMLIPGYHC